ncbi:MAG TPA: fumarylacetoacetate hydrolase family protein [Baekduia sp.]|uniref:fumarylacetoacetate hydrolase family protein n=1 Tax=Baekduia sp. TaxID=2600305 RepID=UPI002C5EF463|nr:fumarylacetoacetate hydrolase family protein [Baekduia sp.]HMJ34492.1 fumarylacetoacetate hydrolase family protein [Baekduia sp.]
MRLVTYESPDGLRAGILVGERIVDAVTAAEQASLPDASTLSSVRALIGLGAGDLAALDGAAAGLADEGLHLASVTLGPPVPDPDKIICVGLNYREHAAEAQMAVPDYPVLFAKFRNALIGDGQAVEVSDLSDEWDYEAELGVVIGRRASGVAAADALEYVAGYMPFNDVSARDVQLRSPQWTTGKAIDRTAPCGPALVLADEVPDPQALALKLTLNGEVLQEASTAEMIFPVATLVEYISRYITLEPGDIIATGTPAGVGFKRDPVVRLKPGDLMETEIEGIGRLTTPIIERPARDAERATTAVTAR